MICDKCGFNFQDLIEILGPEVVNLGCPQCRRQIETNVDDMLCDVCKPLTVGNRVRYKDTGSHGIVDHIALQDYPFRVRWEDGDVDWFRGSQLERVERDPKDNES